MYIEDYSVWGYHLIFDGSNGDKECISSPENIKNFAKEMVEEIDMISFGEPIIQYFGKDDKTGFTLIQLIETSNISGHFCDPTGHFFIDVFSCKKFDEDKAIKVIEKYFKPQHKSTRFLIRGTTKVEVE